VESLSNEELRNLLVKHGQQCGPVLATTRKVYENKLKRLLSGGRSVVSPTSLVAQSTPIGDRLSTSGSGGTKRRKEDLGASPDMFADASNEDLDDDDRMEGEESFRYIGPVNDSEPSPYSALGGSMIRTPPVTPPRTTQSISSAAHRLDRLDYGFQNNFSQPKPASGFSSLFSRNTNNTSSKTSTISYHTTGGSSTEAYRRTTASTIGPRTAEPTITYGSAHQPPARAFPFNLIPDYVQTKAKEWAPTCGKILGGVIFAIFVYMVAQRFMQESGYDSTEDEEVQKLPA